MRVGTLKQIWRYPVKSMEGESINSATFGPNGIPGDRAWAVRDEEKGGIRGAKKIPALMTCKAGYPEAPGEQRAGKAEITLPDGTPLCSDDPEAAAKLSEFLGKQVTLWPLQPADKLEHYRRGAPDHEDLEQELRSIFGRTPDEPLPDLTVFPPELMEFESPPGTYFDAFPLLLLTESSLQTLQSLVPESAVDVRRFRPNLVIATEDGETGFVENSWAGKSLRIGSATLKVTVPCPRCVMVTHGFGEVPKDPQILRTLVRDAEQNLGVYAEVESNGAAAVGDAVELI